MNQINQDQIKDLANLYDIKYLSQAIADRGWAFMCHTTRQDLAKSDVPTLYNDIFNKYLNAEKTYSDLTQGSDLKDNDNNYNTFDASSFGLCVFGNTTYGIFINDYSGKIYYSSSYQTGATWALLSDIDNFTALFKAGNCIIALSSNSVYKINPSTNTITKIGDNIDSDYGLSYRSVKFKLINGVVYIIKKSTSTDTSNIYKRIYYVADDTTTNTLSYIGNYSRVVCDLEYINNNWYVLARNSYSFYVYKGPNLNSTTLTDTTAWELKLTYTNSGMERNGELFYGNGRFAVFFKAYQASYNYIYTDDDFVTTNTVTDVALGSDEFCELYFCNNIFFSIYKPSTFPYLYSCHIDNINTAENWTYDTSITPDPLESDSILIGLFLTDSLQLMAIILPSGTHRNFIYYRGYGNAVYTDNYNINETIVDIQYYKYNDFKICISDGGTNDANLETVYNYLGYLNYWLLDTANETITTQRNKQGFALMFVGDNFIDALENLPTTSTRILSQAQEIVDSSATVSLAVKGNVDYKLVNSALTSLTLNSYEDSALGTTIQFNSGATATTITDSTNIEWTDGAKPEPSASKTCLIFIWNNKGFYKEW